jgi:glycine hydroxymethyltransferase
VVVSREGLLRSLDQQRRLLASSIVLTPTDSLPFSLADREHTAFLHGLYISDKVRDREASKAAVIQFGGRNAAARDIASIHRLLADALGAAEGSLRLLAGLQAHTATFMSISRIGQTVMLLPEEAGGHYSTHAILQRLGLKTIDMVVDYERLCVDHFATLSLIEQSRPDFVFVDRSEGLRFEDFSFIGGLDGPTTIFDASQYLSQILTNRYENPLAWGFDLMLFTLHKSFPGPQKAGIVSRQRGGLWEKVLSGLSALVSSSHAENSYLVGLALLREQWLEQYVGRLLSTALELEAQLLRRGVSVVVRERQGQAAWPATHHIWISSPDKDKAFTQFESLTQVNVQTNYRKLPYDLGYGLRLGTSVSSICGVDTPQLESLAEIIQAATEDGSSAALRSRVGELARSAQAAAIVPVELWS